MYEKGLGLPLIIGELIAKPMKRYLSLAAIAVSAVTLALIGVTEQAEAAAYLKFEGIDGESQDKDHKNWSDILSFSQTISREGSTTSGSARAKASATFHDIVITKEVDKSTPKLAEALTMGRVIPTVELHMTASYGGAGATYLSYELKNVMIKSWSVSGDADDRPTEEIAFNFAEIKVTYSEVGADGKSKGNVEYTWKVEEGTK